MTESEILGELRTIVRDVTGQSVRLTGATDLLGDLQLDSLKQLELVVEIENRFGICLDAEDEQGLATVAELVTLIGDRMSDRVDEHV